jgi:uncharacterized membrane protein HdeD (DUF308 family)
MVSLTRNWWTLLIRGLLAIAAGIITFMRPGVTLTALVLLFGAYAFVTGVMTVVAAVRGARTGQRWVALLLEGLVGIAAGVIAFVSPGITALALIALISAWAVISGVFEIAAAIRLRKEISDEWLLGLAGVASIAFGVLIWMSPTVGAVTIALIVGVYALLFGVVMVALGFRLRSLQRIGGPAAA